MTAMAGPAKRARSTGAATRAVVAQIADDVVVMRRGKVVESGPAEDVFERPRTDYTKALMAAAFDVKAIAAGGVSQ